jgi:hypothetical protein
VRVRNPDQCYRAVVKATEPPEHVYERGLWNTLHSQPVGDPNIEWALEIFTVPFEREIFQAWLLARATEADIERWLRIPPEVTQVYAHLFFNVDIFRDELDLLSWVQEFEKDQRGSAYGTQLLRDAVQSGLEKLCWVFGRNDYVVDPDRVKQHAMTDLYLRSLAGRGHSATSKEAQAALAHSNAALKAAQIVGQTSAPDAQAFLLKLRYREMTTPVTETDAEEKILH